MKNSVRIPNEDGYLGRYDDIAEKVCRETEAMGAAVLIIGGKQGNGGFSVAVADRAIYELLPDMLESMARNIRAQLKGAAQS
jgi:hypothetical protein